MDDKVKGLAILQETIQKNITHPDYKRVNDLATEYYDIFTGANLDKYIKRIVRREDDAMFKQRMEIYQSTIPSVVENLEQMFNKPLRSNRVFRSIEHGNDKARSEIIDRISKFYTGEYENGLEAYMYERWKWYNIYEPNSFIAVEFSAFNPAVEKTFPFPLEYSSKQAINYKYKNGELDWFIAKLDYKYYKERPVTGKKEELDGNKYIMYLDNTAIVLYQVDKTSRYTELSNPEYIEIKDEKGAVEMVFVKVEFAMKSKRVPLIRAGFKLDAVTKGRTCVSIIHSAMPFFKKEMKAGSEFDITMSMHAFPFRIMYGKRCEGDKEKGLLCKDGMMPNGKACSVCGGTKVVATHPTSAQDVFYVAPPKTKDDPVLDLEKALIYKTPPAEFIKFQEDYVDRLSRKAKAAVFAEEAVQKKVINQTATELDYSYDNVYDTYFPYCQKYSSVWKFIVRQIATYTDNEDSSLKIYHQFPKDFKLKGVDVLLNEARIASESGLSQHAINAINNDVLEALYSDDQNTLTKIKVRERFHPFSGKTPAEIQSILMSGQLTANYRILYTYFNVIFNEIDNEIGEKFYLLNYTAQKQEVMKRVDVIKKQVEDESASRLVDFREKATQDVIDGQQES